MSTAERPPSRAYLCVELHLLRPLPVVVGVRTFSSPPEKVTRIHGQQQFALLLTTEGRDFQEALDRLYAEVWRRDDLAWCRPFLSDTMDAHMARGLLYGHVKAIMPKPYSESDRGGDAS